MNASRDDAAGKIRVQSNRGGGCQWRREVGPLGRRKAATLTFVEAWNHDNVPEMRERTQQPWAKAGHDYRGELGVAGVRRPLMNVIDALFATEFREDGTHAPMTLPEYASQYLADIEHRFGPRDRSFALVGIDIDKTPGNVPRTWFPDSGIAPDDVQRRSRHVVIRLGPAALTDLARAR